MPDFFFTKRLKLKKITRNDLELIVEWSNDQAAYGHYLSMENFTLEECLHKFQNGYFWNDKSKTYLIVSKENEFSIGTAHYWTKPQDHTTALFALKVAIPEFRGQGYGAEVQTGLVHELFNKMKFKTIEVFTDIDNTSEQKCLKKLNFSFVNTQEYQDQGIKRQGYLYKLTLENFERSEAYNYYYG